MTLQLKKENDEMANKKTNTSVKKATGTTPARKGRPPKVKEEELVKETTEVLKNEPTIGAEEVDNETVPVAVEDAAETQETSNAEQLGGGMAVLSFEDMRKRLKLPVLPSPAKDALVKIAVVTGMEKQEKQDLQLLMMFAEWRDNAYSNEKKYYAVMNGPNAPYVKEYARSRGKDFQPVHIMWQYGAKARQMAYGHLVSQLDKNSVLIILYGRPDANLLYLKGIASRKGIPVIYMSNKELNHGV